MQEVCTEYGQVDCFSALEPAVAKTTVLNVDLVIIVIPIKMFSPQAHVDEIVKTMSSTVYMKSCNNTRYHNFQTVSSATTNN